MTTLNNVKEDIADCLAGIEKSYNLPKICKKYNLEPGEEDEAFRSKRKYVSIRLENKSDQFIFDLTKKIINDYDCISLSRSAHLYFDECLFDISSVTRRKLIDNFLLTEDFVDSNHFDDLISSVDSRFNNAAEGICQYWGMNYLFEEILHLMYVSDKKFITFIEKIVHPKFNKNEKQEKFVKTINAYIKLDGFELIESGIYSGYSYFKINRSGSGVSGNIKNLIFSADGPKPEIVLSDSINNNIKIVKNEEHCLVYDRPIKDSGLLWSDLVIWWSAVNNCQVDSELERSLYKRLFRSLDSDPEKLFFRVYFSKMKSILDENLPALIPQVYLHYDPYTLKYLKGDKRLSRQRMDFLLIFSKKDRIIIEIDGKQHYSIGDKSNPKLYSEMVSEDRELKLKGYDVYRFGGFELTNNIETATIIIEKFFIDLFSKYNIISN
jgi:very-short-patch-repair endonuclease